MKKNRAKNKKAKKILGIIALIFVLFVCATVAATVIGNNANIKKANTFETVQIENQLVPQKDENGNWTFTTDKEFKVMQLTDIHIGGGWMSLSKDAKALNAVAAMVTAEKPDLVVVTGDIAYPVPFQAGTFNNLSGAKIFAELMEKLGVYWTVTLGNHDSEIYSYYGREKISNFYAKSGFTYCLYQPGPDDVDGYGNHVINVKNSAGKITQSIYMLDSQAYTKDDPFGFRWLYDNVHENQVEWYKKTVKQIGDENGAPVNSLMFMHIPLTELNDAWFEYADNGYQNTENVELVYGVAGEKDKVVYCGVGEDNLFETILELDSTKAVFFGHDHKNNFAAKYKGIQLSYSYSVDYLAYIGISKEGEQRGCTIINVKPDGSFVSHLENYYQDKYVTLYEKEEVTMQEVTYN
ncbi:MAG: metallophosphoesterase [Clostridia bacterium]|nr:metallophosphoesterase [Clostridia bacterium]